MRFRTYMANREIIQNLNSIDSAGAPAAYFSVDIRDAKDLASVTDRIKTDYGPISAIIHGAGVLADQMMLPANVPAYALRSERLGRYLEDEVSIGDQVEEGEEVTVTPKTHLGAG